MPSNTTLMFKKTLNNMFGFVRVKKNMAQSFICHQYHGVVYVIADPTLALFRPGNSTLHYIHQISQTIINFIRHMKIITTKKSINDKSIFLR